MIKKFDMQNLEVRDVTLRVVESLETREGANISAGDLFVQHPSIDNQWIKIPKAFLRSMELDKLKATA